MTIQIPMTDEERANLIHQIAKRNTEKADNKILEYYYYSDQIGFLSGLDDDELLEAAV
jgi:hypothetical protein